MLRRIIIEKDTSLEDLHAGLVKAKSRNREAEAALAGIRRLNPKLDPGRIKAGTILVIPDSPDLKVASGEPVSAAPWSAFTTVVDAVLGDAARNAASSREARSGERAGAIKILNSAAFKKALSASEGSDDKAKEAVKSLEAQEAADREAGDGLAAMRSAVLGALAGLDKIIR